MASEDQKRSRAILVVDDEADIRQALEMVLSYEGFEVWTARDGEEAWKRLEQERERGDAPALVLSDLKMPNLDGLGLLDRITAADGPPVVLISGHGDVSIAVDAMQRGAVNFLEKPLDQSRVLVTVRTALRGEELAVENRGLRKQLGGRWRLVGESPAMTRLRGQVEQVAQAEASVLITGENGVGKEVVARNLHLGGPRASKPFVTVNCAAIPAELIESELFGHEKGAFTGATDRRTGHFEAADGGTLFLDEIGDMPLAAQAKVLRALENHEVTRVGASEARPVNIRVLAATNADLVKATENKSFRMDLFFRLNVVPLAIPPLRERLEDIPELVETLLSITAERSGRRRPQVSAEVLAHFQTLAWPGNVRQLKNVLEGAAVFADDAGIGMEQVEQILASGPGLSTPSTSLAIDGENPFEAASFEDFKTNSETLFFRMRLARNDGNVKRTAEELGMQRSHLYKKLDRYELR
ncbi:MAG: two-component system nitrogen regulation response regulator NtrX [Planctomycetota bacterium]|jgi:two-component system nitrogen regulation response regulator NtrX